jgi:hypothetical protein
MNFTEPVWWRRARALPGGGSGRLGEIGGVRFVHIKESPSRITAIQSRAESANFVSVGDPMNMCPTTVRVT